MLSRQISCQPLPTLNLKGEYKIESNELNFEEQEDMQAIGTDMGFVFGMLKDDGSITSRVAYAPIPRKINRVVGFMKMLLKEYNSREKVLAFIEGNEKKINGRRVNFSWKHHKNEEAFVQERAKEACQHFYIFDAKWRT